MKSLFVGIAVILFVGACSEQRYSPSVRMSVAAAPELPNPAKLEPEVLPLSTNVDAKIAEIRGVIERDSLNRLVRVASNETNFVSNFAGESHKVHWDLLRRTGFDPLTRLEGLLDGPYGTRQVGTETWYIWPDFAAAEAEELLPEKLSFADRARLERLVGDAGLSRIRSGQAYPGIRTAIAEDGRWLYFVHETVDETQVRN